MRPGAADRHRKAESLYAAHDSYVGMLAFERNDSILGGTVICRYGMEMLHYS